MKTPRSSLGRKIRSVGAIAATALACLPLWGGVAAQSVETLLIQRRLELRQAKAEHEAARRAYGVVEQQFSAALGDVNRARRAGDDDALESAYARAQARSAPLRSQDARVADAAALVDRARQALIDVLTVRLQQLVGLMDAAASSQQRDDLDAIWRDLHNELRVLEAEAEDSFRLDPVVLPDITFDPRDGPEDLRTKAQLLERQAAVTDTVIQNTDRQIGVLEERLRVQRQRSDLLANVDRFDDTRVPVVSGGTPAGGLPADSTGIGAQPMTLEERIDELHRYRTDLEGYRDQLLVKAATFRRRIRSVA